MIEIEVDTEVIREYERIYQIEMVFHPILDLLKEHGEITLKKVDKITMISKDTDEEENWPYRVMDKTLYDDVYEWV